jgi:nucleolar protein 14
MLGDSDSDKESSEENRDEGKVPLQKKKMRDISGDGLGENFLMDNEYEEKGWVDQVLAQRGEGDDEKVSDDEFGDDEDRGQILGDANDEDSQDEDVDTDDGSDEEESAGSEDGWEQSEDELVELNGMVAKSMLEKTVLETAEKPIKLSMESQGSKKERKVLKRESEATFKEGQELDGLPFVLEAPQTLPEFQKLVDHRSVEELATAIQRIRKCNAISLAAENQRNMQVSVSSSFLNCLGSCYQKLHLLHRNDSVCLCVDDSIDLGSHTDSTMDIAMAMKLAKVI